MKKVGTFLMHSRLPRGPSAAFSAALLTSDGLLVDGGHRIAKALINGQQQIDAVFIEALPPADVII
jgi:hypothetical protein